MIYKHLSHLPFYVIPQQVMALTPDQIRTCTTGTQSVLPGCTSGNISMDRTLAGTILSDQVNMDTFADPDTAQSSLIQNLVSLPAMVKTYQATTQAGGLVAENAA